MRDADAMGSNSKQPRQWCLGAVVSAVHRHNTDVKLRNVTMPIPVADEPSDVPPHTEHLNCTHATYLPVHAADSCCGLQNFFKDKRACALFAAHKILLCCLSDASAMPLGHGSASYTAMLEGATLVCTCLSPQCPAWSMVKVDNIATQPDRIICMPVLRVRVSLLLSASWIVKPGHR